MKVKREKTRVNKQHSNGVISFRIEYEDNRNKDVTGKQKLIRVRSKFKTKEGAMRL